MRQLLDRLSAYCRQLLVSTTRVESMRLAKEVIKMEEGWRARPYYCTEGYPTIGYGFRIGDKGDPLPGMIMTLSEGNAILDDKVNDLALAFGDIEKLGDVRSSVIISMAYQLGIRGVRNFKNMWAAIDREDWSGAAYEMMNSLWARQTPARAERHANAMRSGDQRCLFDVYL